VAVSHQYVARRSSCGRCEVELGYMLRRRAARAGPDGIAGGGRNRGCQCFLQFVDVHAS
jgi:hypothetical protein